MYMISKIFLKRTHTVKYLLNHQIQSNTDNISIVLVNSDGSNDKVKEQ